MKNRITFRSLVAVLVLAALVFAPLAPVVLAAPPAFPALGSAVFPVTFHVSGAKTATVTNVARFVVPFNARIIYATASVSAKSGTHLSSHGRSSVQILNNGNIVTQGATQGGRIVGLAIGVPTAGTGATETNASAASGTPLAATAQNVTAGNAITLDMYLWGSSPSVTDTNVVVWLQRAS